MTESLRRFREWPAAARLRFATQRARRVRGIPVFGIWVLAFVLALVLFIAGQQTGTLPIAVAIAFAFTLVPRIARPAVIPLGALLLALLYPFYWDSLFSLPLLDSAGTTGWPSLDTAFVMLVYVMMAIGLNIVVGYAGLLDLGYVAFYAMGAYTAAWFASGQFARYGTFHFLASGVGSDVPGIHISIWIVLLIAGCLTALIGVIIGLPTLRLRGDYLAIVTLGFGEIVQQAAKNSDNLGGFNLTNGAQGINPIDQPGFGHGLAWLGLPASFSSDPNESYWFYWTALFLVVFIVFVSLRLRDSRLGRAWVAIREDETAAAAMGIPLMRTKTWAYACGAFFGGIAGAIFASWKQGAVPDDFLFNISVFILSMVILGGMGNVWGVIVGGAFLAYLNQAGLGNIGGWANQHFSADNGATWFGIWHGTLDLPLYSSGIFGAILIITMLFRPEGLIPSSRRKAELHEGVRDTPLVDADK
jgi:branched-chain amino acid transport system permease protein